MSKVWPSYELTDKHEEKQVHNFLLEVVIANLCKTGKTKKSQFFDEIFLQQSHACLCSACQDLECEWQSTYKALQSPSSALLCTESQMTGHEADNPPYLLSQHIHPASLVTKPFHRNFKIRENNEFIEQYSDPS